MELLERDIYCVIVGEQVNMHDTNTNESINFAINVHDDSVRILFLDTVRVKPPNKAFLCGFYREYRTIFGFTY